MPESATTTTPTSEEPAAPAAGVLAPEANGQPTGVLAPAEKSAEAPAPAGAPEKYEPFTVPEGMTLDQGLVDQFLPIFKAVGLTQASAQKLVEEFVKNESAFGERGNAIQKEIDTQQGKEWEEALKTDSLIGGSDHAAKVGVIKRAVREYLDRHGEDKELVEFYSHPALASHPGMARLIYYLATKAGEATTAGTHGGGARPTEKDRLDATYPTMKGM